MKGGDGAEGVDLENCGVDHRKGGCLLREKETPNGAMETKGLDWKTYWDLVEGERCSGGLR